MNEELKQRILDRYDVDELVDIMSLKVEDLLEAFDERIYELYLREELDV